MPAMAYKLDTKHLRQEWFPRVDSLLSSAAFAKNRYRVQRVCVCAIVLPQDEREIRLLNKHMPMFSVTQEKLDWQPEEDQSVGAVFTHLTRMSDCPGDYLLENVESSEFAPSSDSEEDHSYDGQSFRLSSLEVYNGDCSSPGYHIGATAFQKLTKLRDSCNSDELWRKWLIQYILEFDESPRIVWAREGVTSAVLWQVQLDIIDTTSRFRKSSGGIRRGRYGPLSQVYLDSREENGEDVDEPEAKRCRFRGVRYRPERKKWVAEMRLPKGMKKNKVSFGDYQSEVQAARAVDVAFHHYGKEVNFGNTAEILKAQPALEGLEGEAKLRLVKDQAKWVANQVIDAPSQPACTISTVTAKFPDAASSRGPTADPHFLLPSPSPSLSLDSLLESYGSGDEVTSTRAPLVVVPEHVDMDVVNESGSFGDQTEAQSIFQFYYTEGTDPGDLLAICSPTSTLLVPMDSGFQDDDADHRMWEEQESFSTIWNHVHEQDSLFSGL